MEFFDGESVCGVGEAEADLGGRDRGTLIGLLDCGDCAGCRVLPGRAIPAFNRALADAWTEGRFPHETGAGYSHRVGEGEVQPS